MTKAGSDNAQPMKSEVARRSTLFPLLGVLVSGLVGCSSADTGPEPKTEGEAGSDQKPMADGGKDGSGDPGVGDASVRTDDSPGRAEEASATYDAATETSTKGDDAALRPDDARTGTGDANTARDARTGTGDAGTGTSDAGTRDASAEAGDAGARAGDAGLGSVRWLG